MFYYTTKEIYAMNENKHQLTVRVNDEVMSMLTRKSEELGITRNLVINMILTKVVRMNNDNQKKNSGL